MAAPVFLMRESYSRKDARAARIHLRWMTAARCRHGQQRPSLGDGRGQASTRSPRSAAICRPAASGASLSRRAANPPPPPQSSSTSAPMTCRATSACSICCLRRSPSRRGSTCIAFSNRSVRLSLHCTVRIPRGARCWSRTSANSPCSTPSAVPAPMPRISFGWPRPNCSGYTLTAPLESTLDVSRTKFPIPAGSSNGN